MNSDYKGLYIHFPFCKRKCYYCDFYTENYHHEKERYFFEYLKKEFFLKKADDFFYDTLYFGGGSPSLINSHILKELKGFLNEFIEEDSEISIEVNPEDIDEEKVLCWKELNINRISIGIQGTDKDILRKVNRKQFNLGEKLDMIFPHFDNINFDFILGLPGENESNLMGNLNLIKEYNPEHVSYYIYDNDHDSPLNALIENGEVELPANEKIADYHDEIVKELFNMGFNRYEISSWSKKSFECKHNLRYWKNYDYIGLGPSAGGHCNNSRYVNIENFEKYKNAIDKKRIPINEFKNNNQIDELFEVLFMGLRLIEGINFEKYHFNRELIQLVVEMIHKSMFEYVVEENSFFRLNNHGLDHSHWFFCKLMDIYEEVIAENGEKFG